MLYWCTTALFETVNVLTDINVCSLGVRATTVNISPTIHAYILLSPHVAGVLADVLNYVLLHAKDTADARGGEKKEEKKEELLEVVTLDVPKYSGEEVLVACFRFLKALGKNNIQIQRRCAIMLRLYKC